MCLKSVLRSPDKTQHPVITSCNMLFLLSTQSAKRRAFSERCPVPSQPQLGASPEDEYRFPQMVPDAFILSPLVDEPSHVETPVSAVSPSVSFFSQLHDFFLSK